jgi:hypothetical protein
VRSSSVGPFWICLGLVAPIVVGHFGLDHGRDDRLEIGRVVQRVEEGRGGSSSPWRRASGLDEWMSASQDVQNATVLVRHATVLADLAPRARPACGATRRRVCTYIASAAGERRSCPVARPRGPTSLGPTRRASH